VNVHGVIVGEASGSGRVADEASFIKSVDRVRVDPAALGLALHIDSRGGSALASARMLHAVRRCARDKPVVAYFADVAASGGYMIGVGAHEIVAHGLSLTGSIGVVAARVVLAPLFERLGIDWETLKRGARADMLSPVQRMDETQRSAFMAELEEHYASFVAAVAEGRNKSVDEIEAVARGRVWTGRAAVARGLVDAEGGFQDALDRLRQRVGPRGSTAPPKLVSVSVAPKLPSFVAPSAQAAGLLLADYGRELAQLCADKRRDRVWAWAPFY
jgi:protease-4